MKKNVLVGIRIDSESRDLLSWALVKVAEPGDCVVAVHVSRTSSGMSFKTHNFYLCCIFYFFFAF